MNWTVPLLRHGRPRGQVAKDRTGHQSLLHNEKIKVKEARKHQLLRSWSIAHAPKVFGHRARRTAALNYICFGRSISHVAFLGWRSSSVM